MSPAFAFSQHLIFDYGPLSGSYGYTWINDQSSQNFAERCSFPTTTTVTRIDIFTSLNLPGSSVHIKILSNAGGVPGSYLYEEDQIPASWELNPSGLYRVVCNLSTPFVAQASAIYWIGVAGNNSSIGQTAVIAPGDGRMAVFNGSTYAYSTDVGDMMFQLYGSISFSDVPQDFWAYDYIVAIYDAMITDGYPDGTYRPSQNVSRAQMAAFIIRANFGEAFSCTLTPHFSDVPADHWAFKYVQKMYDEGITAGYSDGTYRPSQNVSRSQMAAFIIKALYPGGFTYTQTQYFSDVLESHWAFQYVQKMYDEGITAGYSDGTYRPSQNVSRSQMAAFIGRAFLGME
jgi:hypothetical protein